MRSLRSFSVLGGLLVGMLLVGSAPTGAKDLAKPPVGATDHSSPRAQITATRRVNAPYFDGSVRLAESAIFWFGRVTPTENSVDVRVGYNDEHLRVRVAIFDRRLWCDTSPSPDDLTDWDAVTLYLGRDGNVGNVPDANAYRFDAHLARWWDADDNFQAAYQGDGSGWVSATVPFTTIGYWSGNAPNDGEDDRGWWLTYDIPFDSLGLKAPPAQGTVWGTALAVHDRDDGGGKPIANQVWPETMAPQRPSTWGQLAFGMPTYSPQRAVPAGTVTIRHGLEGASVVDADVGGSSVCGQPAAPDYFPTWGDLNYAGKEFVNIQNLFVDDWPCFSRYYVTFPLDAVPAERVIVSATLTLHLWGGAGAGYDPGPQPSLIQVLTVGEDWNESTLTWNSAPLAVENVAATWVEPVEEYPGAPGIPYEWDVSRAVAERYAKGEPVRLALYEADLAIHSGKYFHSSDVGDWNAQARPTLDITYGRALADPVKAAAPSSGDQGTPIAYTVSFLGTGATLALTDTLPRGLDAPDNFELEGTGVTPTYDAEDCRLTWSDTPSMGQEVVIHYATTIATDDSQVLVNTVELSEGGGLPSIATTTVIANPKLAYLPLIFKNG